MPATRAGGYSGDAGHKGRGYSSWLLGDRHAAQFRQFARQPVAQWAFRSKLFEQGLGLLERFIVQFAPLKQIPPTCRNLFFGEQALIPPISWEVATLILFVSGSNASGVGVFLGK